MPRSSAALALTAVLLGACAGTHSISPEEVQDPVQWGAAKSVHRLRHLWIADQPDVAGIDAAKGAGVRVVIDLRAPGERDWDEGSEVAHRGLTYYNVPVPSSEAFSDAAFDEIERVVKAHAGEQILLHCSSGNRAAAWLTAHLVRAHGMTFDAALAVGQRAGITKPAIVEKVAVYLGELPP